MNVKSLLPIVGTIAALAVIGTMATGRIVGAAEPAVAIPPPAVDATATGTMQTAAFAGGCFWGVQGVFQHIRGVSSAVSGYAGGHQSDPTYEMVSTGNTGHAESVLVTYDPSVVSYGTLLRVFFSVAHDPTQLNRQGPDHGTQYRSAIFTTNDEQRQVAAAYVDQLGAAGVYGGKIVTQIAPLGAFYRAEAYHQDYATRHPTAPYIVVNDLPKIANLRAMYPELWSERPQLVFGG